MRENASEERHFKPLIVRDPMSEGNMLLAGSPQVLIIPLSGQIAQPVAKPLTETKALGAALLTGYDAGPALRAARGMVLSRGSRMTVHRWPHLLFAAAAFLFPACISITARPGEVITPDAVAKGNSTTAGKATESARKTDFGIFRPGDSVATKPIAKDAATTAQKPQPASPGPSPPGAPVAPPVPAGGVASANEPNAFRLAGTATVIPEQPLIAAARAYIEGRPERAIEAIAGLDKSNQDFVLAMLPALVRGATADLVNDPVAVAMLVEQLRSAAARLEPRAALHVDAALFCRTVVWFGRYDPRPENEPYKPNDKAQLYIEVRNLVSQPAVGPRGETFLTNTRGLVEIRDAHGKLVPQPDAADSRRLHEVARFEDKKFTRTPLHDFHVVYTFPVPSQPGVYTITVQLSDAAGRRAVKTAPVQFLVAGP